MNETHSQFRRKLLVVGVVHTMLILSLIVLIVAFNHGIPSPVPQFEFETIIVNSSILSTLGGLLYFSRKVYVYMITDKYSRVAHELEDNDPHRGDKLVTRLTGYILYLSTRPAGSILVGPLLVLAILAGLTTLVDKPADKIVSISTSGIYFVYFGSFICGYSSSDLFDYFSALGGRLVRKIRFQD